MGTVKGCGYDGQQKCTICDACRLCHSIQSIVRPVFHQIQQIYCAYKLLRRLHLHYVDIEFWRFFVDNDNNGNDNNNNEPITLPLAHARGVISDSGHEAILEPTLATARATFSQC